VTSEMPAFPLTICLLGEMDVRIQGQPLARLRSRKEYQLLALLTLAQGRPRERIALAQTLWPFPDHSVDQAGQYLRRSLSELRKALGPEAYRLPIQADHTLQLNLEGAEIDIVSFDRALQQGNVGALEAAVALYRNPLLLGHTETWVETEREVYRQRCLRALRMLSLHAQQHNDRPHQIAWLQRAVVLEPTAESIHRMLMEALVAHGESATALLVYQELSRTLHRLCHREPDPLTTVLFRRIRHGKLSAPSENPLPISPGLSPAGYIPYPLTAILGREEAADTVLRRLEHARLLTLTGTGGVGKTRLAIHVAHLARAEYPDGTWFIDLAELTKPELIPERIAGVLEIDLRAHPGQSALRSLQAYLGRRQALLILDNCEHLHAACAQTAEALLTHCGALRLLTTSRRALGLLGEALYHVPPLETPDSTVLQSARADAWKEAASYPVVQLFAERAAAIRSEFFLHADNLGSIVQICAHLDGLPLAVELAAARVDLLTVDQIARKLDDRFTLLTQNGPAAPRQKTLRALLDWSYDLLAPQEKTILERLSVLRGNWDIAAAEAVCAGEGLEPNTISKGIESLVDHSLVLAEPQSEQTRYRMLETVRRYGQDRLDQAGVQKTVWARYRDYFLAVATEAERALRGPEQARALAQLERENENLRAVLEECLREAEGETALRLAGLLWRFWYVRGYYEEGADWLDRALAATSETPDLVLLKALTGAGNIAYAALRLTQARACYTRCLEIQKARGDSRGVAAALSSLANVAQEEGDNATARSLFESALEVFRSLEQAQDVARTLGNLALVYAAEGDYARALPLHRESVALFRRSGDGHDLTHSVNLLANTLLSQGDLPEAAACLKESLTLSLAQESRVDQAHSLVYLRKLAVKQERRQQAALLLGAETALREEMQMPLPSQDTAEARSHTEQLQAQMGLEAFHAAYRKGRSLSPTAIADLLFPSTTPPH
jgi:predicted ATPase/DNA-binding SARP family transcriptional activator